jgi:hypothetical protein
MQPNFELEADCRPVVTVTDLERGGSLQTQCADSTPPEVHQLPHHHLWRNVRNEKS